MSLTNKTELASLIADIQEVANRQLTAQEAKRLAPFFSLYYKDVEHSDLRRFSSLDLFGAAMAHYEFALNRKTTAHKVRVYNPNFERDGWQSTHSAIEIVTADMPFLIDSITLFLARHTLNLHLLVHPVLAAVRKSTGALIDIHSTDQNNNNAHESFIHAQIDRISDPFALKTLQNELDTVIATIRLVVSDEPNMRAALAGITADLALIKGKHADEAREAIDFLHWAANGHFLFMGYCDYDLVKRNNKDSLKIAQGSGLGILKDQGAKQYSESFEALPVPLRELAHQPQLIILNKSQTRSIIHRSAYIDYIGIKRFNAQGCVAGEQRFLGLYTAYAYQDSPKDIPILRRKVEAVIANCHYVENSYKAKMLQFVLESHPRDELFEIPVETLTPTAIGIVNLQERPRVRLFIRTDRYHRYVSCLVYVPRDSFNTDIRLKIEKVLLNAFNGVSAEFSVQIGDGILARVHYIVRTHASKFPIFHEADIEAEIERLVRGWVEELQQQLIEMHGEEMGNYLFIRYKEAFPLAYREEFAARNAVLDILQLEALNGTSSPIIKLYRPLHRAGQDFNMKLFTLNEALGLSNSLPILENMGVTVKDEHPYCITRSDGSVAWISDFGLDVGAAFEQILREEVQNDFQEHLAQVFTKRCENDGFNRLTLMAQLNWREISLVRALAKYLRQGGLIFSQNYIEQCVTNFPEISQRLVKLFVARLHPQSANQKYAQTLLREINERLARVENLDEDRILNGLLTLILATRRTNFWQSQAGQLKTYISFKFESGAIPFLPQPQPLFEIWVYSPRIEGVHLRGSKVARGGLRWSDRMEDFRTEVLGLVKAQMAKNSVIVPMGSKGGFVCKQLPPACDRETWQKEGIACYKIFVSALLDLTDNLVNGEIVPPIDVRRLDEDDPYLVVAADKGTATFSDIANDIALIYGFWLGDAFASGGSVGYDHKKMGITARGVWESSKRHFRHLGIDTQSQHFSVIGIGDMSGDVFGNAMLLSEQIQLKAAFNHIHIFLDPQPDPTLSYKERKRLFQHPRSSWNDYNAKLISKGGGVFERTAKSLTLTAEIKEWLNISRDQLTPNELIRALLMARADLLYNGGIGTYIKASSESHADVRDRANDALRVDANALNVRVIAEGGNLGCTQKGRIEFALKGGLICSDAIDNSAGVDCSDHEVNIKILLGAVIQAGDMTLKQRNVLLADMTDEVGQLVLQNNYLQTEMLAIKRLESASMLSTHGRLINHFEKTGVLSRELEFLPTEVQINERRLARQGLTSPEVGVLLAYSKISLDQALLNSDLPDDDDLLSLLINYFPQPLQKRFGAQMKQHYLKREIIANQLANQIVNRMGTTFIFRIQEESSFAVADIARAWWVANQVYDAQHLWQRIEALDNLIAADTQMMMMVLVRTLTERVTRWVLRNKRPLSAVNTLIKHYSTRVQHLLTLLPTLIDVANYPAIAAWQHRVEQPNMPNDLSAILARLDFAVPLMDIIDIAEKGSVACDIVAQNYYHLERALQLDWLRCAITSLPRDNRWQSLARTALRDDLYRLQHSLVKLALSAATDNPSFVDAWLMQRKSDVETCHQMFAELQAFENLDLAMLSAMMRELSNHLLAYSEQRTENKGQHSARELR